MPLIPIATEYSASATDLVEFDFECAACGVRSLASVLATSVGVAVGLPIPIGAAEDRALARSRALEGIDGQARGLALIAKCQACGARDPRTMRGHWAWAIGFGLFRGALIAAPISLVGVISKVSPFLIGVPLGLVLAALFAHLDVRKLQRDADKYVEFHAPVSA